MLAAGSSSRLGKPKQLLQYHGKTLLKHTIDEAAGSLAGIVVVVLGAGTNLVSNEINGSQVKIIENKNWKEGMASSMRIGLNALLLNKPDIDAVIFMVCDQPFVTSSLLNDLIAKQRETQKSIVASNYGETIGPPALFHQSLFAELMELKGDVGARRIIQLHSDEVATVFFPDGKIDIDTQKDYDVLKKR